jgi:hypothetical protein
VGFKDTWSNASEARTEIGKATLTVFLPDRRGDERRLSEERPPRAQGAVLRFLLRAYLVLSAALAGFTAGAALSSAFVISRDAGLAGAAEAVVYGAGSALIAAVLAAITVRRMDGRVLSSLSLAAGVLLVLLFVWALWNQQVSDGAPPPSPAPPVTATEPAP